MQSHFFHAAKKHTDDPVTFVVRAFAAVAKSNSLLVTAFANDRERLGEVVKNARTQFQQLCTDAAGGVQTNPVLLLRQAVLQLQCCRLLVPLLILQKRRAPCSTRMIARSERSR
jgi:hypothetical protein